MATKKAKENPGEKLAQTIGAAGLGVVSHETLPETPAVSPPLTPGGAAVVAALVAQGYSYDEACAMLKGDGKPKKDPSAQEQALTAAERERIRKLSEGDDEDLPPVADVPDRFEIVPVSLEKREGFSTLLDDLWTRREEMQENPKKTRYRVTFDIEAPEFDWLLHRTIQEGQARKEVDYNPQRALNLLLKQQKALDPTRGGKRAFGGSGPKDAYNPATGGWNKT